MSLLNHQNEKFYHAAADRLSEMHLFVWTKAL